MCFCLFHFKPVKSTSRQFQSTYWVQEWDQRMWCRLSKQTGPEVASPALSRLSKLGKFLWDNSSSKLRWSDRKPSASFYELCSTLPSLARGTVGPGVHTLLHVARSAFQAWWTFSSRWQNTHIENSKVTQGFCFSFGPLCYFFKSQPCVKINFANKNRHPHSILESCLHSTLVFMERMKFFAKRTTK